VGFTHTYGFPTQYAILNFEKIPFIQRKVILNREKYKIRF